MEQKTNTLSVPYSYARCYNEQCRQAENCLRRMAALYDTADYPFITILNPVRFPKADGNCSYFQKAEKVRMAWGVKGLLYKIPYEDAVSIKQQLIGHFGKTKYYRFYREERYLTPKEQAYIRQVFRNKGITEEPPFTRYTDEYMW
ncbi:DUF6078 family protein [Bacteroides salyersiae]|jgi:hypothetical protein|uniref:DUF6078 family protein n=1 Tax=Bacteroides salyersiae TaxID=291644 RepID=UPI00125E2E7B|nr:DUF6078 family protein [Bacteroides salyersiae]KAB5347628.1 hypothetical protein GAA62_10530 [Bacteroides salyersiae]KAB5353295.1 hypothetical protein GAA37_11535 [Bacteroides salyersiae]KAB5364344.1 hypothetical protein F9967_02670 [Bacteroides salyersiae]KAB5367948.1 hypothetical protein GAA00_12580 [Bacteroides salyersiae]KAB5373934.1 hypothetical protein F9993_12460 [Bacteroides salyersiae]